jgi:hypothetical protein
VLVVGTESEGVLVFFLVGSSQKKKKVEAWLDSASQEGVLKSPPFPFSAFTCSMLNPNNLRRRFRRLFVKQPSSRPSCPPPLTGTSGPPIPSTLHITLQDLSNLLLPQLHTDFVHRIFPELFTPSACEYLVELRRSANRLVTAKMMKDPGFVRIAVEAMTAFLRIEVVEAVEYLDELIKGLEERDGDWRGAREVLEMVETGWGESRESLDLCF